MAFGYASPAVRLWERNEYACVGVPPEKRVAPERRGSGAVLAAIARVLRDVLRTPRGPADKGLKPEPQGR